MKQAPLHPNESDRILTLLEFEVLDTEFEAVFDNFAILAGLICQTPISLISLVDEKRQWFKAALGLDARETGRDIAFCSHAILQHGTMVVPDATIDDRFCDNPLVTGEPSIRFYAGSPLVTSSGLPLGTLCVIDRVPRELTHGQNRALEILSHQVISHLEMRKVLTSLKTRDSFVTEDSKSIQRLLAMISHDLRAPFSSIIGWTELMTGDFSIMKESQIIECLGIVKDSAYSGLQLLENLLELSLLKNGFTKPEQKSVYLESLLHQVKTSVSGMAVPKKISLEITCVEEFVLTADPRMLQSIFQNLLSNALKFTEPGGSVKVCAYRDDNGSICVAVQDTGIGISSELIDRLNAGDQINSSYGTANETGTGLGLILCREFCQSNNASLTFASIQGEGTTSTVRFQSN